ncbi:AbiH family protein [Tenacibaculum sp. ZH5_bin.1]|uniref:AbiH family protein n=1 Tax=unclassified Tenacibaculum TaxID=2635139 RepID=UPI0036E891D8
MKKNSDNAVVIIGNGFDLAHDLKTSYNDFSEWYLENFISLNLYHFLFNPKSSRDIIDVKNIFKESYLRSILDTKVGGEGNHFIKSLLVKGMLAKTTEDRKKLIYLELKKDLTLIKDMLNNKFLGKLFANQYENWFDIENAYFHELNIILKHENESKSNIAWINTSLNDLNTEFKEIKDLLKTYLSTIKPIKSSNIKTFFNLNFRKKSKVRVVNFNYTWTIDFYLSEFRSSKRFQTYAQVDVVAIHGKLDSKIIFGYGDDDSKEYKQIKDTKNDNYLENFKTFQYLENTKYRDLINEIEDYEDYEVYVLGHSLSLTDKTLLKEIFSSEKCLNIHLFKRPDKDEEYNFQSLNKMFFNISRILNNEAELRMKIVPMEISSHFPYKKDDESIIESKNFRLYGGVKN